MTGSADCWRRERLEVLDCLSFSPISSRLGGGAGLERRLVTTCHGPQWLVLIRSCPDEWGADLTCIYDMGSLRGWARGEVSVGGCLTGPFELPSGERGNECSVGSGHERRWWAGSLDSSAALGMTWAGGAGIMGVGMARRMAWWWGGGGSGVVRQSFELPLGERGNECSVGSGRECGLERGDFRFLGCARNDEGGGCGLEGGWGCLVRAHREPQGERNTAWQSFELPRTERGNECSVGSGRECGLEAWGF